MHSLPDELQEEVGLVIVDACHFWQNVFGLVEHGSGTTGSRAFSPVDAPVKEKEHYIHHINILETKNMKSM